MTDTKDKDQKSNPPRVYSQVCIWPGCIVGLDSVEPFTKMMLDNFNTRVEYLEELETAPHRDKDGCPIEGTGGRNDLFFAVHPDDVGHFAVPRLSYGIRWIEDVYGNGHGHLYPARCADYKTW